MKKRSLSSLLLFTGILLLAGCSSSSRYDMKHDIAPDAPLAVDHVEDAQPKYESYSTGGNRDYTLRGQTYSIVRDPSGYTEQGIASWYGNKFHGHLTSNGEIYDMYSMSAAHKTLPLPSYVKVTNLDNNKTVIVRVNDRGPFHEGRIIDLSYAAAYKLGVIKTGTAQVKIDVIKPLKSDVPAHKVQQESYVIQVAAAKQIENTRTLSDSLSQKLSVTSFVDKSNQNYKVLLGPFYDYMLTQKILDQVKVLGYDTAFIRKYAVTQ